MDPYTENLTAAAEELYEYDAIYKFPQIIASFRGQGASLSEFLDSHGYSGEDSASGRANYLKQKFHEAGIEGDKARYALKWLTGPKGFERDNAFRIAFALHLDVEQTDELFRTVMLDRSFDCHTIREAVYYYCICRGLNYSEAEKLIEAAPDPESCPVPKDGNVLYTKNIISFIRSCPGEKALLQYFRDNLAQFGYNQVKAKEYVLLLWKSISAPDGLAFKERKYLSVSDKPMNTDTSDSTWNIYLQILGLDTEDVKYIEKDRTIKPILDNRIFMHQFSADNFPNRQNIEKILRGVTVKHDLIRKTLILFAFYQFWINTALSRSGHKNYAAGENDRERCISELDQYLMDAGFPEMYAGNPYDWIYLWAAGREAPLLAFRSYWQLLSAEYSEQKSA